MRTIFVTGSSTDVGKTVVSAVLTQALKADYWKPIQTGAGYDSDTERVKKLVTNGSTVFHKEAYSLKAPIAPYASAKAENISIDLDNIHLPETTNTLIIEGAGGLFVPLNEKEFIIDLIMKFNAETILVVQNYLGSINHTILSIEAMKSRNINILGIIVSGISTVLSEEIIFQHSGLKLLGRIQKEASITPEVIKKYEAQFSTI
ncbi:MAG TPA: dethiobiotin synthase [Bacteroidia bacterium]